jgi:hypothetical protein
VVLNFLLRGEENLKHLQLTYCIMHFFRNHMENGLDIYLFSVCRSCHVQ